MTRPEVDPMAPALVLEDVSVVRGGRIVWSQGTFSVRSGAVVGVIGPNGAGKTTLFQVALGLLPVAGGRVEVLGAAPRRGNHRIGYVPQNYTAAVNEAVRCRDLVTLGLTGGRFGLRRTSAAERARVDGALERVGAAGFADRRMSELSGGQQQRVAIAQAIVDDAELLLLDEPLANLDLRNQQEIVGLLGDLHRERRATIMIVAHDLNPLLPVLTDAVYLLDGHPHHDPITDVVQEELLTHLYGTPVGVVRTAQGDLFTRAAWRDVHHHDGTAS
jgi:zinc/manganese transport system ATP-binding protein